MPPICPLVRTTRCSMGSTPEAPSSTEATSCQPGAGRSRQRKFENWLGSFELCATAKPLCGPAMMQGNPDEHGSQSSDFQCSGEQIPALLDPDGCSCRGFGAG